MQTSYRKVKQYNNIGEVDHGAQALTYKLTEEQYAELVRRGKELAERQRQLKNETKE